MFNFNNKIHNIFTNIASWFGLMRFFEIALLLVLEKKNRGLKIM